MMRKIVTVVAAGLALANLTAKSQECRTFGFQGQTRAYCIYVPSTLDPGRPLVFMLHGHGGNAADYFKEFVADADRFGFVLCCPQGLREPTPDRATGWNVGYPFQEGWKVDDCRFIIALGRKLVKEYGLNPKNVFFSGMSNGGEMCYLMAHRYPEKFAGIASLAGLGMEWIYRSMKPSCPVPFLEIHGTKDMVSKWNGDLENKDGWGKYIGVPQAVGRMVSTNCCTHELRDTLPVIRNTVIRHHYTGGTDGKDVFFYEIIGGGHSTGAEDLPLGEILREFFSRYISRE